MCVVGDAGHSDTEETGLLPQGPCAGGKTVPSAVARPPPQGKGGPVGSSSERRSAALDFKDRSPAPIWAATVSVG